MTKEHMITVDEYGYYHKDGQIVGCNTMSILVDVASGTFHGWGDTINSGIKDKYLTWYNAYLSQGNFEMANDLRLIELSDKFSKEDICTVLNFMINCSGGYSMLMGLGEEKLRLEIERLRELGY